MCSFIFAFYLVVDASEKWIASFIEKMKPFSNKALHLGAFQGLDLISNTFINIYHFKQSVVLSVKLIK